MMMSCCGTSYAQWCDPVLFEQILGPYPEQESYFGSDIYVSGDMAIVGAQGHVVDGLRTGAVHVYRNDGNRWNFESLITPSDVENDSLFGVWISVDDGSMLIGSYETGVTSATGKVYCYRYIDGQWMLQQILTPSDGIEGGGFSFVEHAGDRAVVGAPGRVGGSGSGAVYVFEYDGKQWVEVQKLTASDGTAGDLFGVTPNLLGDRLVVGAPDHLEEGWFKGSGAVYIFEFDGNEWQEAAKLSPTPFEFGHRFGYELWLMEDMVLIADLAGSQMGRSGEVLVYEYAGGDWLRTDVLESPEPNSVDLYGGEIEVQGDVMLVGAPDAGGGIGTAYVYRLIDGVWHASGEINSPLDDPTQSFGARMELFGDSVMIGSPLAFGRRGHVSVFELDCRGCRVDLTGEGRVNFLDISAMMTLFINGDMAADFSGDGGLDFFDLSAFLSAYEGGCP
tara:strand:- start:121586 stop:122929 length:1344 start_codon:yes stop_codon:yes gene_type:complete